MGIPFSERIKNAKSKIGKYESDAGWAYGQFWKEIAVFVPSLIGLGVETARALSNPERFFSPQGWVDLTIGAVALLGTVIGGIKAKDSFQFYRARTGLADNLKKETDIAELKGE